MNYLESWGMMVVVSRRLKLGAIYHHTFSTTIYMHGSCVCGHNGRERTDDEESLLTLQSSYY